MKDHQLGFIRNDGPDLTQRENFWLGYDLQPEQLPDHITQFNSEQFLNPDGSYTPTPAQTMEIVKGVMEKEAKAARARAAYAPILKELNKMDRDPDPAATQSSGQLAQGLYTGQPMGGGIAGCRCDACTAARMSILGMNQNALYSKMAGLARS